MIYLFLSEKRQNIATFRKAMFIFILLLNYHRLNYNINKKFRVCFIEKEITEHILKIHERVSPVGRWVKGIVSSENY